MKPPSPLLLTPLTTATAAAAPSTLTRLTSTTTSTTGFVQWISPHAYTHTTALHITRYEPQQLDPSLLAGGSYPATTTQLAVTRMTVDETTRFLAPASGMKTTRSTTAWTAEETWVVSPRLGAPSAGELEVGAQAETGCAVAREERCEAMGLGVGCQGRQCEVRGGWWWCLRMEGWEWVADEGRRMGRVCWGEGGRVRQLGEACRVGDGAVGGPGCEEGWVGVDLG
ncbi:hypothetical protein QBC39DRAFT_384236 [Podospora conica]|nr:hypothetical protein QBC39DRAFT_384236 [Schizothecium conicum]